jgi:hypothetical protein
MRLFFIEYDLRKRKDYPELIGELTRIGAIRMLKSSWCVNRADTVTAKALREHLEKFIDADDGLMVSQVADWSCRGVEKSPHNLT